MSRLMALAVAAVTVVVLSSAAVAADPEYRIGVDDVLTITVWDNKDLDRVVFVRPDGRISLPLLGEIHVQGLTVAELTTRLSEMYSKTVKGAELTVGVQEIRSRPVFFLGGIARVGPMQLTQQLTLLQAISAAGGLVPAADLESAYVLRGKKRIAVDFVRLIQSGDLTQNIELQPGDTVVVPVADVMYVQGEVKAPGAVKVTKDLTLVRAIVQAGGFTPLAAPKRVTLIRNGGSSEKAETMEVNVQDLMTDPQKYPDVPLKRNDIIIVPQRLF